MSQHGMGDDIDAGEKIGRSRRKVSMGFVSLGQQMLVLAGGRWQRSEFARLQWPKRLRSR